MGGVGGAWLVANHGSRKRNNVVGFIMYLDSYINMECTVVVGG